MRTMYDAVNAKNIPVDAAMVAGYIDTIRIPCWTQADWDRFPRAVKVRIAKKHDTNDGHVLDVEVGDATPAQAPDWAGMRRAAGVDPTIYCNRSTWPAVQAAFTAAKVAQPHFWIATATGTAVIPAGAVAAQYSLDVAPGIDISVVADFWPGVDSAEDTITPSSTGEDLAMHVIPANPVDDFVSVPADGKGSLFIASAFGHQVAVLGLWAIGDTVNPNPGHGVATALGPWTIDADRPGPIPLPKNTRCVTVRFKADHPFTTWCA